MAKKTTAKRDEKDKVGMIFECGPEGADLQVCRHLGGQLTAALEFETVPLGNKPALLRDCGTAAARLLAEGCLRVLIVWALYPAWREQGAKPCRREDCAAIHNSLANAGVTLKQVALICIREELEAWLRADRRAVSAVLSSATHKVHVPDAKHPE